MKERPILFNAPMVRAILEGRKTMTRRVIRPQPPEMYGVSFLEKIARTEYPKECPYGQPGDRLWVRETFATLCPGSYEGEKPRVNSGQDVRYAATDRLATSSADVRGYTWRPSIFMPRWASRILLEVKAVRVERVQDIQDGDAQAEGAEPDEAALDRDIIDFVPSFRRLWDSINAKRGYGWDDNPWVWVIEFARAALAASVEIPQEARDRVELR
jgi:hypothetical protein